MTRLDHLTYCSVCRNRKAKDFQIVCGLTDKIADFEDTCDKFDLDSEEKEKGLEECKAEIRESLEKQKSFFKQLGNSGPWLSFLTDKSSLPYSISTESKEVIISESKSQKAFFLILPIILWGAFANAVYKNGLNVKGIFLIFFFVLIVVIPIYFLYLFFRNKELFRVSKLGIIAEQKQFVPWYQIRFIYFEIANKTINLILRLSHEDDIKIEITNADKPKAEIGQIVYSYIKKYKRN